MISLEIAKASGFLLGIAVAILLYLLLKYSRSHGMLNWPGKRPLGLFLAIAVVMLSSFLVEQNRAPIEQRIRYEVNDPEQLAALGVVAGDTKEIRIRKESNELGLLERPVYQHQLAGFGLALICLWFMDTRKLRQAAEVTKVQKPLNIDRSGKLAALNQLMEVERLYRDQALSLDTLAQKLDLSRYQLSQLMNEELGKNFYAFVNEYRVNEAIDILNNPTGDNSTLLALGYQVGFNSKASFYRAFKKYTELTPAQYKKKLC